MFDIESWDNSTGNLMFGKGGFQGARGGPGSDWWGFFSGVDFELD